MSEGEPCKNCVKLGEKITEISSERDDAVKKLKRLNEEKKDEHENIEKFQNMASGVEEVKNLVKEMNIKVENLSKKEVEGEKVKEDVIIVKDIVKDIQKSAHIIQHDVGIVNQEFSRFKNEVKIKEAAELVENIDIVEVNGDNGENMVKVTTEQQKELKLNYQKAPDSSGIVFAGDRSLDVIRRKMVDTVYDLCNEAEFNTSVDARCKEFIVGDDVKGIKLGNLKSEPRYIILAFGRNDLFLHNEWINQEIVSQGMTEESILKTNLNVAGIVAETVTIVLKKIAIVFKNSNLIYILPHPSVLNENSKKIFNRFRDTIAAMDEKPENLTIVDAQTVWENEDKTVGDDSIESLNLAKEKEDGAGTVSFKASRILMKHLFKMMNPDFEYEFCTKCYGVHEEECPRLKMYPASRDRNACFLCASVTHKQIKCPWWPVLKQVNYCPHCGSNAKGKSPGHVTHNPDLCPQRYEWCDLCDASGHHKKLHDNPNGMRAALARIGGNTLRAYDHSFLKESKKREGLASEDQPPRKK